MDSPTEELREIATVYDHDCGVKGQLRFASMRRRAATWILKKPTATQRRDGPSS